MKKSCTLLCLALSGMSLLPLYAAPAREQTSPLADTPAAPRPYSLDGEVVKISTVARNKSTTNKVVVVSIHVDSGNVLFDELRVRFDEATGKAEHAWWATKGWFAIGLPKEGLLLKDMPPLRSDVKVTFDRELPEEAAEVAGLRLLSLTPQKPPSAPPIAALIPPKNTAG